MPASSKQKKYKPGQHPNSRANLRPIPWKPGQSGNPKGESLTSCLQRFIDKPLSPPLPDAPAKEQIVYATLEGAILREPTPFREVWDRLEGKVAEPEGPRYTDNRVINIIVSSEEAKRLTENVGQRLLALKEDGNATERKPG